MCSSDLEAAGFLLEYADVLASLGANVKGAAGRVKQLLNYWTAGGMIADEEERGTWLREKDPARLLDRVRERAAH